MYSKLYSDSIRKIQDAIPNIKHLRNKKILVTGASGLICSALIDFLMYLNTEGYYIKVYAAVRNVEKAHKRFDDYEDVPEFNILEYDAEKSIGFDVDCDFIVHGASNANPDTYSKFPVETMVSNFAGMLNLLNYAINHKTSRTLYMSSSEVYGNKKSVEPYCENDYCYVDILNPRACYPSAKRATETLCAAYGAEYGVDTVIIRPGHVYGPTLMETDTRASSQFARDIMCGRDIVMKSAGTQMRSYCYVMDCVSALLTVLLNGETGEAYNISNPDSVCSIREMAEAFANAGGKRVVFEHSTDAEKASYNLMDNSALNAEKLICLGWKGRFKMDEGVRISIVPIKAIN